MSDTLSQFIIRLTVGIALVFLLSTPMQANAARIPKGAIKLSKTVVYNVGKVRCGLVKAQFVPGRIILRRYFYSRLAERSNTLALARTARSRVKKQLLQKAKTLLNSHKREQSICLSGSPQPTSTPRPGTQTPTSTPIATPTPSIIPITLKQITSNIYNTEHALFIIPDPNLVTFEGSASRDSVYSNSNINSYVATLKTYFPDDYFFVTIVANNLLPSRAPDVSTYRYIADGIGQDGISGVNVPNICRYQGVGPVINGTFGVLDHEIGHNWSSFIGAGLGNFHWRSNSTILGQMAESYSNDGFATVKQIRGDPVSGFTWSGITNVEKNETDIYSDQDLYLQGLNDTFPTTYVLNNPVYNGNGTVSHSGYSTYDQSWVEANFGVRSPTYRNSPKKFRIGFIYIARNLSEIEAVYQPIEQSAKHYVSSESINNAVYRYQIPFLVSTKYRGSVDGLLEDLDGNVTPSLSITGAKYQSTTNGSASFSFSVSDDTASPIVSCVNPPYNCVVTGNTVVVSGLPNGSHFFTIKAQDSAGKKTFEHLVVDAS